MARRSMTGSLRQVMVLTAAGILGSAVQVLPGRLAGEAGGLAWLAPLAALPVALIWGGLLCAACKEEGMDLAGMVRREFGKGFGRALTLLYIVWIAFLMAQQWRWTLERMRGLTPGWGWLGAGLALALALRMVWKGRGPLCRAAQIFWLVLTAVLVGVAALALGRVEPRWLLAREGDWAGLPRAAADCLGLFAGCIPAVALVGNCPRERADRRRVLGWITAVCLIMAAVTVVVVGQLGPALAGRLPRAFYVVVQGLGVEGGFARLEDPVSALWLLADFSRFGLLLAAASALAGPRTGRWMAVVVAAIGILLGSFFELDSGLMLGLFLGGIFPVRLWIRAWFRKKRKEE